MSDLPVKASAEATASYERTRYELILDSKVYPPCYSKIEQLGKIQTHKFSVKCDMKSGFVFSEELVPFDDKIRRLDRLRKDGLITEEEYRSTVQDILTRV
jgi:Short C-terminal domain